MSEKKEFKRTCECGREIVGFSEHHAQVNLDIHRQTSKFHKEVMKLLKKHGEKN